MAASNAVLNNRDVFLGERRCVICGIADPESLQRCNIVGSDDGRVRRMWNWHSLTGWKTDRLFFLVELARAFRMDTSWRQIVA